MLRNGSQIWIIYLFYLYFLAKKDFNYVQMACVQFGNCDYAPKK